MIKIKKIIRIYLLALSGFSLPFMAASQVVSGDIEKFETERTNLYAKQLENYLKLYLVDQYNDRTADIWARDYSSIDAFVRSVGPNRIRWADKVIKPPVFIKTGPLSRKPYTIEGIQAEWVELPLGPVTAQAILAFPEKAGIKDKVPLILVQHGIGSTPETTFRNGAYNAYAKELVNAGYAVLVPMNLQSIERRNRIERLCRLADVSLPGIELVRAQHLLDVVLADPKIDTERVGMWGLSLGGMATMFWMPLEPRLKAGVVSGWFNHRCNKMVIPDDRYSCFLETKEEHAFFTAWLTEFSDHDVVSLICPRPLLVQHGKKDHIAHWPQVIEEFNMARKHYEKLNISDRIQIDVHEGGHESVIKTGIDFLDKWIKNVK